MVVDQIAVSDRTVGGRVLDCESAALVFELGIDDCAVADDEDDPRAGSVGREDNGDRGKPSLAFEFADHLSDRAEDRRGAGGRRQERFFEVTLDTRAGGGELASRSGDGEKNQWDGEATN